MKHVAHSPDFAVLDNAVDLDLTCYPQRRHGLMIEPFRLERPLLVCHPYRSGWELISGRPAKRLRPRAQR